MTSMTFSQRNAFLSIDPPDMSYCINFTVIFATTAENGILLYHGQHAEADHLAIELFRGHVRVSYDAGNFPAATMFGDQNLNDGVFHKIQVIVCNKNVSLKINDEETQHAVNEGESEYLGVDSAMYIGGLPSKENEAAVQQWHLRNGSSFSGN